ncbi:hypothetical protein [Achromobacter piechaudii]|uniref:hypothetical protein n=1 Tax=Achromobacter piechaudii TaxID=72556 RepID=UPI0015839F2E|nr:hypothetical protein [Achromobacter piechaudii]
MDRYAGKPLLRLLECYVLHAIGHLDAKQGDLSKAMEPKLAEIFGAKGTWIDIVSAQVGFAPEMSGKIRAIWEAGVLKSQQMGLDVDPNDFAVEFVDTNFSTMD